MSTVFISYGGPDEDFATQLNKTLNDAGIITFFFPIDSKPGEKLHHLMRDGVNKYQKIVFICSEHSLERQGVLNELEEALQREAREGGEQILVPINLDNYVFKDWNPKRAGLKQAILDRVVGNFVGAATSKQKFIDASNRLISALGSSMEESLISWETTLDLNETGSSCIVKIERTFITYIDRNELVYHGLNSTGNVKSISTSSGKIKNMVTEGGNKAIYVVFDKPLPLNEKIHHYLIIEHENAFTENKESYSNNCMYDLDEFSLVVNFPSTRLVKDAYLKLTHHGKTTISWSQVYINSNKDQVRLSVRKPFIGAYYTLEWLW